MIIHNYAGVQKISLHHGNKPHCQLSYWILFKLEMCMGEELLQKTTEMDTKDPVFDTF